MTANAQDIAESDISNDFEFFFLDILRHLRPT
jgi:hypothetical protein